MKSASSIIDNHDEESQSFLPRGAANHVNHDDDDNEYDDDIRPLFMDANSNSNIREEMKQLNPPAPPTRSTSRSSYTADLLDDHDDDDDDDEEETSSGKSSSSDYDDNLSERRHSEDDDDDDDGSARSGASRSSRHSHSNNKNMNTNMSAGVIGKGKSYENNKRGEDDELLLLVEEEEEEEEKELQEQNHYRSYATAAAAAEAHHENEFLDQRVTDERKHESSLGHHPHHLPHHHLSGTTRTTNTTRTDHVADGSGYHEGNNNKEHHIPPAYSEDFLPSPLPSPPTNQEQEHEHEHEHEQSHVQFNAEVEGIGAAMVNRYTGASNNNMYNEKGGEGGGYHQPQSQQPQDQEHNHWQTQAQSSEASQTTRTTNQTGTMSISEHDIEWILDKIGINELKKRMDAMEKREIQQRIAHSPVNNNHKEVMNTKHRVESIEKREDQIEVDIQGLTHRLAMLEHQFAASYSHNPRRTNNHSSSNSSSSRSTSAMFFGFINDSRSSMNMLQNDTFTLMTTSKSILSWVLGLLTFLLQMIFAIMIISSETETGTRRTRTIPFTSDNIVRVAQFFTIIICISTQRDVLSSIQALILLDKKDSNWTEIVGVAKGPGEDNDDDDDDDNESHMNDDSRNHPPPPPSSSSSSSLSLLYAKRILVPHVLKLTQGLLILYATFITILQSDDILKLLRDFTTLMILSEIDSIFFHLANYGYMGKHLQKRTAEARDTIVGDAPSSTLSTMSTAAAATVSTTRLSSTAEQSMERAKKSTRGFRVRLICFLFLLFTMIVIWISTMIKQDNGTYFKNQYPGCGEEHFQLAKKHFGDGVCYGGPLNTYECNFEGGDCIHFKMEYPSCHGDNLVHVERHVGNGECDEMFDTIACGNDGGDCCPFKTTPILDRIFKNGQCNGGSTNTNACNYDNGECKTFNDRYPDCPLEKLSRLKGSEKVVLGDGICDSDIYGSVECGFEDGDCICPSYILDDPRYGDGNCDGGLFNTKRCSFDNGDCSSFKEEYPDCPLEQLSTIESGNDKVILGDGVCDSDVYRSAECGFEDGDCICPNDILDDPRYGDGKCDGSIFNTRRCSYDNGDCDNFTEKYPDCPLERLSKLEGSDKIVLGDGICDGDIYGLVECGFEAGDCICPSYILDDSRYGDGNCDGGLFNSQRCSYDNGDCTSFKEEYPDCPLELLSVIEDSNQIIFGDGVCDSDVYKSAECGFEDNDCICPSSILDDPRYGDGKCDGGIFNTRRCSYDNGDCTSFKEKYPDCPLEQLSKEQGTGIIVLGDGVCDSEIYMSTACGFENGDCICPNDILDDVRFGDGECNGGMFNTPGCSYDNGDCDEFNKRFPKCPITQLSKIEGSDKVILGDDICDSDIYQLEDCGFEDNDCCPSVILDDARYGDGICDGGLFNTKSCAYDNGDCNDFNNEYPNCPLESIEYDAFDPPRIIIGDGICDSDLYSVASCNYEGGDCDPGQMGQDFVLDNFSFLPEMSSDGRKIAISSFEGDNSGAGLVRVYSYSFSQNSWIQLGDGDLLGESEGDKFGYRIAMDDVGGRIAISAQAKKAKGYVKVFDLDQNDNVWSQVGDSINGEKGRDLAGNNIDMTRDGSRIAISIPGYDMKGFPGIGLVRVYDLKSGLDPSWVQAGQDILGKTLFESIGYVNLKMNSLNGSKVFISVSYREKAAIRAYEFNPDVKEWIEVGDADILAPYPCPVSGRSFTVSADGNRLAYVSNYGIVEAPSQIDVLDFDVDNNTWKPVGNTIYGVISSDSSGSGFGYNTVMSSDGKTIAISSVDPDCYGSPDFCDSGSVEVLVFDPSAKRFRKVPPVPSSIANGNILEQGEKDSDNSIFGMLSSMSVDGSKLSVGGYNFVDSQGFVKIYDLGRLFYMNCPVEFPDLIGDGKCEGFYPYNSEDCGFDGGDCLL